MGFFDSFKSKKKVAKVELGLSGLKAGGYVDFDLETYRVEKKSSYEEEGDRTFEWHLVGEKNKKHLYLGFEKSDGREYWFVTEKISNGKISDSDWDSFAADDAPQEITIEGKKYFGDESGAAYFYPQAEGIEREELIYWSYEDRAGENLLTIEQWGENDFELYQGKYVEDTDFYNIIQG